MDPAGSQDVACGALSRQEAFDRYNASDGTPRFAQSCVLFFDVLGVAAMATSALAVAELPRLRSTLIAASDRAGTEHASEPHASTWFTDNVVVGTPVGRHVDREGALLFTAVNVSYMQLILLQEGFLGRGAIAFGDHYMDERFVFGPALIEAVCLEKSTTHPRIALTPEAVRVVLEVAPDAGYGDPAKAPVVRHLLCGEDDSVFVDVFGVWFSEEDNLEAINHLLPIHRRRIEDGLKLTSDRPEVHAKWQWMADYFNYSLSGSDVLSEFKTEQSSGIHGFSPFRLSV
jgi:hypothetical protein